MAFSDTLIRVGLAVGDGTGAELADVFEAAIEVLARYYGIRQCVERSPRVYQSYHSLCEGNDRDVDRIAKATEADAAHFESFCRRLSTDRVPALFRTAVNAQSLYMVRQRLSSVKVEHLLAPG